jgi:TetR/AcrR family transcriptional repressor of nem operon
LLQGTVAVRKSREEAAETRRRIIASAATEFRRRGIAATGLAEVMAAAGLTHGGFYRHFASKDALVAEASTAALAAVNERMAEAASSRRSKRKGLKEVAERYLSAGHRDNPAIGCPLAALGSELARAEGETRSAATEGFQKLVEIVAQGYDGLRPREARTRAIAAVATMIGALTMARVVTDEVLSEDILRSAREKILEG